MWHWSGVRLAPIGDGHGVFQTFEVTDKSFYVLAVSAAAMPWSSATSELAPKSRGETMSKGVREFIKATVRHW